MFPATRGVRLVVVVIDDEGDATNAVDATLDRMALIAGFYRPLVALWESEALATVWRHWDFDLAVSSDPPPESRHPYSVRSARIDAALAEEEV